jgi:hypothetical protein
MIKVMKKMNKNELIDEIKKILNESEKFGFGIGDYIRIFNKMKNLFKNVLEILEGERNEK